VINCLSDIQSEELRDAAILQEKQARFFFPSYPIPYYMLYKLAFHSWLTHLLHSERRKELALVPYNVRLVL